MIAQESSDPRVKRASRLAIANDDLLESQAALQLALKEQPCGGGMPYDQNNIARRCYMTCVIIAYARPFSNNKGNGGADARIEFSAYSSDAGLDQGIHDLVLNLRNKAIAHADFLIVPAQVIAHNQQDMLVTVAPVHRPEYKLDLAKFEKHVSRLIEMVQKELHALSEDLSREPGKLGAAIHLHREQI